MERLKIDVTAICCGANGPHGQPRRLVTATLVGSPPNESLQLQSFSYTSLRQLQKAAFKVSGIIKAPANVPEDTNALLSFGVLPSQLLWRKAENQNSNVGSDGVIFVLLKSCWLFLFSEEHLTLLDCISIKSSTLFWDAPTNLSHICWQSMKSSAVNTLVVIPKLPNLFVCMDIQCIVESSGNSGLVTTKLPDGYKRIDAVLVIPDFERAVPSVTSGVLHKFPSPKVQNDRSGKARRTKVHLLFVVNGTSGLLYSLNVSAKGGSAETSLSPSALLAVVTIESANGPTLQIEGLPIINDGGKNKGKASTDNEPSTYIDYQAATGLWGFAKSNGWIGIHSFSETSSSFQLNLVASLRLKNGIEGFQFIPITSSCVSFLVLVQCTVLLGKIVPIPPSKIKMTGSGGNANSALKHSIILKPLGVKIGMNNDVSSFVKGRIHYAHGNLLFLNWNIIIVSDNTSKQRSVRMMDYAGLVEDSNTLKKTAGVSSFLSAETIKWPSSVSSEMQLNKKEQNEDIFYPSYKYFVHDSCIYQYSITTNKSTHLTFDAHGHYITHILDYFIPEVEKNGKVSLMLLRGFALPLSHVSPITRDGGNTVYSLEEALLLFSNVFVIWIFDISSGKLLSVEDAAFDGCFLGSGSQMVLTISRKLNGAFTNTGTTISMRKLNGGDVALQGVSDIDSMEINCPFDAVHCLQLNDDLFVVAYWSNTLSSLYVSEAVDSINNDVNSNKVKPKKSATYSFPVSKTPTTLNSCTFCPSKGKLYGRTLLSSQQFVAVLACEATTDLKVNWSLLFQLDLYTVYPTSFHVLSTNWIFDNSAFAVTTPTAVLYTHIQEKQTSEIILSRSSESTLKINYNTNFTGFDLLVTSEVPLHFLGLLADRLIALSFRPPQSLLFSASSSTDTCNTFPYLGATHKIVVHPLNAIKLMSDSMRTVDQPSVIEAGLTSPPSLYGFFVRYHPLASNSYYTHARKQGSRRRTLSTMHELSASCKSNAPSPWWSSAITKSSETEAQNGVATQEFTIKQEPIHTLFKYVHFNLVQPSILDAELKNNEVWHLPLMKSLESMGDRAPQLRSHMGGIFMQCYAYAMKTNLTASMESVAAAASEKFLYNVLNIQDTEVGGRRRSSTLRQRRKENTESGSPTQYAASVKRAVRDTWMHPGDRSMRMYVSLLLMRLYNSVIDRQDGMKGYLELKKEANDPIFNSQETPVGMEVYKILGLLDAVARQESMPLLRMLHHLLRPEIQGDGRRMVVGAFVDLLYGSNDNRGWRGSPHNSNWGLKLYSDYYAMMESWVDASEFVAAVRLLLISAGGVGAGWKSQSMLHVCRRDMHSIGDDSAWPTTSMQAGTTLEGIVPAIRLSGEESVNAYTGYRVMLEKSDVTIERELVGEDASERMKARFQNMVASRSSRKLFTYRKDPYGLLCCWRFIEGSGDTVMDGSGCGRAGLFKVNESAGVEHTSTCIWIHELTSGIPVEFEDEWGDVASVAWDVQVGGVNSLIMKDSEMGFDRGSALVGGNREMDEGTIALVAEIKEMPDDVEFEATGPVVEGWSVEMWVSIPLLENNEKAEKIYLVGRAPEWGLTLKKQTGGNEGGSWQMCFECNGASFDLIEGNDTSFISKRIRHMKVDNASVKCSGWTYICLRYQQSTKTVSVVVYREEETATLDESSASYKMHTYNIRDGKQVEINGKQAGGLSIGNPSKMDGQIYHPFNLTEVRLFGVWRDADTLRASYKRVLPHLLENTKRKKTLQDLKIGDFKTEARLALPSDMTKEVAPKVIHEEKVESVEVEEVVQEEKVKSAEVEEVVQKERAESVVIQETKVERLPRVKEAVSQMMDSDDEKENTEVLSFEVPEKTVNYNDVKAQAMEELRLMKESGRPTKLSRTTRKALELVKPLSAEESKAFDDICEFGLAKYGLSLFTKISCTPLPNGIPIYDKFVPQHPAVSSDANQRLRVPSGYAKPKELLSMVQQLGKAGTDAIDNRRIPEAAKCLVEAMQMINVYVGNFGYLLNKSNGEYSLELISGVASKTERAALKDIISRLSHYLLVCRIFYAAKSFSAHGEQTRKNGRLLLHWLLLLRLPLTEESSNSIAKEAFWWAYLCADGRASLFIIDRLFSLSRVATLTEVEYDALKNICDVLEEVRDYEEELSKAKMPSIGDELPYLSVTKPVVPSSGKCPKCKAPLNPLKWQCSKCSQTCAICFKQVKLCCDDKTIKCPICSATYDSTLLTASKPAMPCMMCRLYIFKYQ